MQVAIVAIPVALWWYVIGFLVAPSPAQAYLDPGTGSFVFQCVVGTILGALVSVKLYWTRLKAYFTKKPSVPAEQQADEEARV